MRSRNRAGLTLLEVLLALAILGLGVAALSTATSRCLALVTASQNYHQARTGLELAELRFPLVETEDGLTHREVAETEILPGFRFSRTAETPEAFEDTGLLVLRNRIVWTGYGSNTVEETVRYLYYTNDLAETL